jgi:hypothetical protein
MVTTGKGIIFKHVFQPLTKLTSWVVTIGCWFLLDPKVDDVAPIVFMLVLIST